MSVEQKDRVFLTRDYWQRLYPKTRRAVTKAFELVRDVRAEILAGAKVAELPPVFVLDHAWGFPGPPHDVIGGAAIVHGASTIVEIEGEYEFGVQLPAPVVMHLSRDLVKGVLLHEFAHCFFSIREVLAYFDRGEFELKFVPPDLSKLFDRDWDSARLDPPGLWFADQDVATFLYQHDSAITPCSDLIRREWIARKLPTVGPELRYSIRGTFSIPTSIVALIRAHPVATP